MDPFTTFLKSVDNMGREFKFKIEGKNFSTSLGGFLTLVLWSGFIICTWYFGEDLFRKVNPKTLKKTAVLPNTPFIRFNHTNFFTAVRAENHKGVTIDDDRFFTFQATHYEYIFSDKGFYEKTHQEPIKLKKCSVFDLDTDILISKRIHKYYCANVSHLVGGSWIEDKVFFLDFSLKLCNHNNNKTCYTDKEITEKFTQDLYFDSFTQRNLVNPKNLSHPLVKNYEYR